MWKRIAKEAWRVWGWTRHVLSIRGLLQWTGWWETVTAGILAVALGVWSALKNLPGPVVALIVLAVFVLFSAVWRVYKNPIEQPNAGSRDASKITPKRPRVILKSIMARLSTFELTACDFDAFEIEIRPLACKDTVIGWNLPKTVLLSGETMPATICEIGKSGAYYSHNAPLLLELALEKLTSPDNPVIERSIFITYRDAERQQWQTETPVRYDRRIGKAEYLTPSFSLQEALSVPPAPNSWSIQPGSTSGPTKVPTQSNGNQLNNGWIYDGGNGRATISSVEKPERSVFINSGDHSPMREIESSLGQFDALRFKAKLPTEKDKFYFRVELTDQAGRPVAKNFWFHCIHGNPNKKASLDPARNDEYNIEIDGVDIGDDWREYTLFLQQQIERAEELHGCFFSKLIAVKVRGSVGISNILHLKSTRQAARIG